LAAITVCTVSGRAGAQTPAPAPRQSVRPSIERDDADSSEAPPLRIGALGGIGFPRPLAVEGMLIAGGVLALGAEYGVLPSVTVADVRTSLWSVAGDVRIFPFGGPFFVGLRAGHQHITASATLRVPAVGSATEDLTLDSWFLNPRIGCLWVSPEGLAVGVEAGVQIPVGDTVSSSLPLSFLPAAQHAADSLGKAVLPTVDLLRIGLLL
jgi:hypothetical protein